MFRPRHTLFPPDPLSTCVSVPSSPHPCVRRLPRSGRGVGIRSQRVGAFSSPLPKPIAEPTSESHPLHCGAGASLFCSIAPDRHVGPMRVANHVDFSHCSLREQKESNPRANNALIFNNLHTHNTVTPVYSYTYKLGGGFSGRMNSPQAARITSMEHALRHTLYTGPPFQLSTVDCQLFKYNPRAPFSGSEVHIGANSTWGIDER
jgi:hypothetical protein